MLARSFLGFCSSKSIFLEFSVSGTVLFGSFGNTHHPMILTDLVTNIRIRTTKTNRQQYQRLRTLAELKDCFCLALERQGTWSQRRLKGTSKGKNPKFVHTFCASFEEFKALWHANSTLQLQGKDPDNMKMVQARSQPQNLGGSISTSHSHDS